MSNVSNHANAWETIEAWNGLTSKQPGEEGSPSEWLTPIAGVQHLKSSHGCLYRVGYGTMRAFHDAQTGEHVDTVCDTECMHFESAVEALDAYAKVVTALEEQSSTEEAA